MTELFTYTSATWTRSISATMRRGRVTGSRSRTYYLSVGRSNDVFSFDGTDWTRVELIRRSHRRAFIHADCIGRCRPARRGGRIPLAPPRCRPSARRTTRCKESTSLTTASRPISTGCGSPASRVGRSARRTRRYRPSRAKSSPPECWPSRAATAERIQQVIELGTATPEASRGLISALGWLTYEQASKHIKALLAADEPASRRVGIAASAIHRRNPGPAFQAAFAADDPLLKARAFRAAGELGLVDTHITLRANLKAKDPTVRFWAAWSNALLNGHKDAVAYLQNVAEAGGPFAERAAQMAMRRLAPNDAKIWLKRLVKELGQKRIAVIAAGAFADPEAIPFLIDQMKVPELARVAGESFSLITGANIAYEDLDGEKPEGFEAGPTENPEDEKVAMDADLNLPWPDPALIQKWWNARQGNFAKGTRYLLGQPITPESLRLALKNGYQRQRAAAALELAILKPGRPLFEVRAPGWRQQAML